MLEHGGRLRKAAQEYGIALTDWIDLSTGINPEAFPLNSIPTSAWHRLPETDDELEVIAADYYQCKHLLPVAGSQAAIQSLPLLRKSGCSVAILSPSYNEHNHSWIAAGHNVKLLDGRLLELTITQINSCIEDLDVLLVCNPNNPTGIVIPTSLLNYWRQKLNAHGGWLIVDEAFMDATPELSMASHSGLPGLIVLRSLGKFFGLAGARVGFVLCEPDLLNQLAERLGPWTVSGPARFAAIKALSEKIWQNETRDKLIAASNRLETLLKIHKITADGGSAFFQWTQRNDADRLHQFLAQRGILTRLFNNPLSIRFGLPASDDSWHRLDCALHEWDHSCT